MSTVTETFQELEQNEFQEETTETLNLQTEKESASTELESTGVTPDSQTDLETESPKKKSQRRRDESPSETENISQSGEGENKSSSHPMENSNESKQEQFLVRSSSSIVSIGGQLEVETEAEKTKNDLLDLIESMKSHRILTGMIQGVERPKNNPNRSIAVLYHGDFKIIIPAEEAVEIPDDLRGRQPEEVMHYTLTKRLGAEIDYVVKVMDTQSGIAVASRLEAMAIKRKEYYFGFDRDGNNLLYEGVCAEARVVSVIRAGIFVDLFGVEVYIPLRELSYQRLLDANTKYQPGQHVIVKILEIDRSDRSQIRVNASVKQAEKNPYEKALQKYSVGNRYVGTVSVVDTNGVFVAMDGGIDCLCPYPKRGRPPRGARVTVRILGINHENNRIWGAITHIAALH